MSATVALLAFGMAIAFACHAGAMLYEGKRDLAVDSAKLSVMVLVLYVLWLVIFDAR